MRLSAWWSIDSGDVAKVLLLATSLIPRLEQLRTIQAQTFQWNGHALSQCINLVVCSHVAGILLVFIWANSCHDVLWFVCLWSVLLSLVELNFGAAKLEEIPTPCPVFVAGRVYDDVWKNGLSRGLAVAATVLIVSLITFLFLGQGCDPLESFVLAWVSVVIKLDFFIFIFSWGFSWRANKDLLKLRERRGCSQWLSWRDLLQVLNRVYR